MKKIENLILLLLAMNTVVIRRDRDYIENSMVKMRKQGTIIEKLRELARQEGTLLGRIVKFDQAVYVITQIYPTTVQIDWLNYGDGYSDARAGHQALLDIDYATAYINFEDHSGGVLPKPQIICPTMTAKPEVLWKFRS